MCKVWAKWSITECSSMQSINHFTCGNHCSDRYRYLSNWTLIHDVTIRVAFAMLCYACIYAKFLQYCLPLPKILSSVAITAELCWRDIHGGRKQEKQGLKLWLKQNILRLTCRHQMHLEPEYGLASHHLPALSAQAATKINNELVTGDWRAAPVPLLLRSWWLVGPPATRMNRSIRT